MKAHKKTFFSSTSQKKIRNEEMRLLLDKTTDWSLVFPNVFGKTHLMEKNKNKKK